jgi:ribosomal protein S18 acetylase RimI-like enzyme
MTAIAQEVWTEHYTPIIGVEQVNYMLKNLHSKEIIAKQITQQNYLCFIIKHIANNVGYIGIQLKEDELFLSKIYLKSSVRGLGLGKESMRFIKDLAQRNNLPKVSLTVNKNNKNTIAAYYKFGFKKTGEICADIGKGYVMDDLQMELTIE